MFKLDNVCYRYKAGTQDVLKNVNAEMEAGKLHAIVGPSGSGKTTLLSIMAGMDRPMEGAVYIDGEDLSKLDLDRYRREKVSMVFQAFHLFPLLTAMENVCYPMETLGVSRKKAMERAKPLLESVGIDGDKYSRYPSNLSGGEQQRVAIARALASGAKLILADEPTGNLDSANGNAVMDILRYLAHERSYCVIIVTHNPEIAESADQVFRMKDGKLEVKTHERDDHARYRKP
ncbi:MAG: ABC transporter ATP-binding protein [Defluviitaleaceae bacterium]|nr:ABC transporter ATP-binding protein [Defluviitaleaceae bacterium]